MSSETDEIKKYSFETTALLEESFEARHDRAVLYKEIFVFTRILLIDGKLNGVSYRLDVKILVFLPVDTATSLILDLMSKITLWSYHVRSVAAFIFFLS